MRKEVGSFKTYGQKTNGMYQAYASLYLDFCDDDLNHFWNHHIAGKPLRENNVDINDEQAVYDAYKKACMDILCFVENASQYFSSFEEIYNEYPPLRDISKELVAELCDIEAEV